MSKKQQFSFEELDNHYRREWYMRHGKTIREFYKVVDEIWESHKLKPCIVNVVPPLGEYDSYGVLWDSKYVRKTRALYRKTRSFIIKEYNIELPLLPKRDTPVKDQWTIVVHLPGRISYKEFLSYFEKFQDRLGGAILIEKKVNVVVITVMTTSIKNKYTFAFNPEEYPNMLLPFPIGMTPRGLLVRDLAKIEGIMVAGFKGSGKSKFLHNALVGLYMSRDIDIKVIDLKLGVEFTYIQEIGVGTVAVEIAEAKKMLKDLLDHMNKVYRKLVKAHCDSIISYMKKGYIDLKFTIVVIDEIGEIGKDKECIEMLDSLVKLSRAAGIYVIGATQRPSADLYTGFNSTRSQFPASVCFAVRRKEESYMMLGDGNDRGCMLDFDRHGRGIWQWDIEIEFQAMLLDIPYEPMRIMEDIKKNRKGVIILDQPRKMLPPR